ncbi:ATP phosphoribosyltransferase regulatory subunit [Rivihabitans pingtungensis]|jgi:ATP phosphoribosyltransferase regulatory subunit|uniref:ATP phosphoribosyltransferase regulatory subunit n=1 Tax=Rivihabitans pingtungensis TaxID=1054498 RepID=UPI002B6170BC|nr:ATP phosphoribosyltransferase regulatory subunit [Rivihabitans pingtungensis]HNX69908.1 ATP phosphoribosyltransferase regulatory subunit [Rivihabitans pingtungensis]
MRNWLLPENIADILPATARQVESAKAAMLERFRTYGYELVCPPLIEYIDSLVYDGDTALVMKTFKLDDQMSGRQLGLRADITPQVARIDAHLLSSRQGVTRLCYAGSVLHTVPESAMRSREPLQVGAELYGSSDVGADLEIVDLMLASLEGVGVGGLTLDIGHVGIFRALAAAAALPARLTAELFGVLQAKDIPSAETLLAGAAEPFRSALLALPGLYGPDALSRASQCLPALPEIRQALADMQAVADSVAGRATVNFDLSDLRGTAYHTGLMFAAYAPGWSDALARGGRYDNVGDKFGRARPATGFSLDLRDLVRVLPQRSPAMGIRVAGADAGRAREAIAALRAAGEVLVIDYLGESAAALNCDRALVWRADGWQVEPFASH